jgi:hypothetical protein
VARSKCKRQPLEGKITQGKKKAQETRQTDKDIRTKRKKRRARTNAKRVQKAKDERQKEKKIVLSCQDQKKTHHFVLVDKSHAQLTQNKDSLLGLGPKGQGKDYRVRIRVRVSRVRVSVSRVRVKG